MVQGNACAGGGGQMTVLQMDDLVRAARFRSARLALEIAALQRANAAAAAEHAADAVAARVVPASPQRHSGEPAPGAGSGRAGPRCGLTPLSEERPPRTPPGEAMSPAPDPPAEQTPRRRTVRLSMPLPAEPSSPEAGDDSTRSGSSEACGGRQPSRARGGTLFADTPGLDFTTGGHGGTISSFGSAAGTLNWTSALQTQRSAQLEPSCPAESRRRQGLRLCHGEPVIATGGAGSPADRRTAAGAAMMSAYCVKPGDALDELCDNLGTSPGALAAAASRVPAAGDLLDLLLLSQLAPSALDSAALSDGETPLGVALCDAMRAAAESAAADPGRPAALIRWAKCACTAAVLCMGADGPQQQGGGRAAAWTAVPELSAAAVDAVRGLPEGGELWWPGPLATFQQRGRAEWALHRSSAAAEPGTIIAGLEDGAAPHWGRPVADLSCSPSAEGDALCPAFALWRVTATGDDVTNPTRSGVLLSLARVAGQPPLFPAAFVARVRSDAQAASQRLCRALAAPPPGPASAGGSSPSLRAGSERLSLRETGFVATAAAGFRRRLHAGHLREPVSPISPACRTASTVGASFGDSSGEDLQVSNLSIGTLLAADMRRKVLRRAGVIAQAAKKWRSLKFSGSAAAALAQEVAAGAGEDEEGTPTGTRSSGSSRPSSRGGPAPPPQAAAGATASRETTFIADGVTLELPQETLRALGEDSAASGLSSSLARKWTLYSLGAAHGTDSAAAHSALSAHTASTAVAEGESAPAAALRVAAAAAEHEAAEARREACALRHSVLSGRDASAPGDLAALLQQPGGGGADDVWSLTSCGASPQRRALTGSALRVEQRLSDVALARQRLHSRRQQALCRQRRAEETAALSAALLRQHQDEESLRERLLREAALMHHSGAVARAAEAALLPRDSPRARQRTCALADTIAQCTARASAARAEADGLEEELRHAAALEQALRAQLTVLAARETALGDAAAAASPPRSVTISPTSGNAAL
eukprot:TRINITY_DN37960_c0_g1_i2.p1 TRINITY_DN37960_c0_g1~~TRINITY_DN37960_c0_g1_i2.p1  ORF type:complete len:1022 (+),score=263.10 TRINITY_DN37960_c0_g1_i2:81-3068(+)